MELIDREELFFVQAETEFEWGNPANRFVPATANPLEQKLAAASFRWRKVIEKDPQRGPFEGVRAIIHTSQPRTDAFSRLIECGKGSVVVGVKPPYKETYGATHCIAELGKLPRTMIDFAGFAAKGVAVVGPTYVNDYLLSDPPPKVEGHLIDEFKPFWSKRKTVGQF